MATGFDGRPLTTGRFRSVRGGRRRCGGSAERRMLRRESGLVEDLRASLCSVLPGGGAELAGDGDDKAGRSCAATSLRLLSSGIARSLREAPCSESTPTWNS